MGRAVIITVVTFAVILHSTVVLCKSVVGILHAGCPFPGIPKYGEGKVNKVHNLTPSSNITFNETDVIDYTCSSGWMNSTENHTNITCQHDGVWTGEAPKCHPVLKTTDWFKDFFTIYPTGTKSVRDETFLCNKIQYSFIRLVPNASQVDISNILELHVHLCPKNGNGNGNGKKGNFHVDLMSVDGIVIGTEITDLDRYSDELTKIFKIKSATSNLFLKHIEITVVTNPIYVKGVFMLMKSDDYCGFPPVPVNSIVEVSEPHSKKLKCVKGDLIGNDIITCNQSNGQWSPPPVCDLNESPANNSIGIGAIIGIIFSIVGLVAAIIGFFYFKRIWDGRQRNRNDANPTVPEIIFPCCRNKVEETQEQLPLEEGTAVNSPPI